MKSILFVSETGGFQGGVEKFMFQAAGALRSGGVRCTGFFRRRGAAVEEFGAAFDEISFDRGELNHLAADADAVWLHKCENTQDIDWLPPDKPLSLYVHDHDFYCFRRHKYWPLRRINCQLPCHAAYCFACGSLASHRRSWRDFARLLARLKKRADVVIAGSDFMLDNLRSNGFAPAKLVKIEPLIELAAPAGFQPDYASRELLFAGQFVKGKGVDLLLRAFAALPDRGSRLIAAGDGPDWEDCRKLAADLGVADRVEFPGFVVDLEPFYRRAAALIFPSRWQEPYGMSGPEAMAYGLPVAGFSVGGVGEWLQDGANGFAVAPDDVAGLSRAMLRLLCDRPLAARLGRGGRSFADGFTPARFVERFQAAVSGLKPARGFAPRNTVLGIGYDNVSMATALKLLCSAATARRRVKVGFVNADCFNKGMTDRAYRETLGRFDLVFPDGSGAALAGKLLRKPLCDNVNGTDLLPPLLEMCEQKGFTVFFFGGRPGVAETMRSNLMKKYPRLRTVGVLHGYTADDEAVGLIAAAHPDLLLVAKGAPLQEFFIDRNFDRLGCTVAMGVGGLFDFFSGRIPRAPGWLRRLGLEWCFRLAMEPRRMFRRYVIGNPLFVWRVLRYGEKG
ncbi:MAG: WecB/TagA/CpsF family glycosyltransferase [Victivallaceae bacterium]|nr:WecB/TagA/CpsF family glycosyltransferase [Victivallaceae bacterium]